eukprot:TRINITY_DN13142_c0_g1_i1.p1 TRINITY_DN13142_c0_g1~~TRINITY_DN13142_c0_g1_i1.p1  ORF type:complete len:584 (+),score=81.13 TRINITY_DN13142_c0_g1_i1:66-1817(+)
MKLFLWTLSAVLIGAIFCYGEIQQRVVEQRCSTCRFFVGRAYSAVDFKTGPAIMNVGMDVNEALEQENGGLSFTIEAWVFNRRYATGDYQSIFSRFDPTGNTRRSTEFNLQITPSGYLNLKMGAGDYPDRTFAIDMNCGQMTDNTWQFVSLNIETPAGELNPSRVAVMVDGQVTCEADHFEGNRNDLREQPFIVSGFFNPSSPEKIENFQGFIDEVRVWAGSRHCANQLEQRFFPLDGSEPLLAGYYNLDEGDTTAPYEVQNKVSGDTTTITLTGSLATPLFVGSLAPLRQVIQAVPGEAVEVELYAWSRNPSDEYNVIIDGPENPQGTFYRDAALTEVAEFDDVVSDEGTTRNDGLLKLYYVADTIPTTDVLRYFATSRNLFGEYFTSLDELSQEGDTAVIEFGSVGCDGKGGEVDECGECSGPDCNECRGGCDNEPFSVAIYDDCGVCGGTNFDDCRSGCDNEPNSTKVEDECGVCGGDGLSCKCWLSSWRSNGPRELDSYLTYVIAEDLLVYIAKAKQHIKELSCNILEDQPLDILLDPSWEELAMALERLSEYSENTDDFNGCMETFNDALSGSELIAW